MTDLRSSDPTPTPPKTFAAKYTFRITLGVIVVFALIGAVCFFTR